jgi:hypothetical protein
MEDALPTQLYYADDSNILTLFVVLWLLLFSLM